MLSEKRIYLFMVPSLSDVNIRIEANSLHSAIRLYSSSVNHLGDYTLCNNSSDADIIIVTNDLDTIYLK